IAGVYSWPHGRRIFCSVFACDGEGAGSKPATGGGDGVKIVMFYHTLVSDWNHGNAHFLRGIATELISRGHEVVVYEPSNSWSYENLVAEHGQKPIRKFHAVYP